MSWNKKRGSVDRQVNVSLLAAVVIKAIISLNQF